MSCTLIKRSTIAGIAVILLLGSGTLVRAQTFSVVYNFGSQLNDPVQPFYDGIIAQGRDGNLYSSTSSGGANNAYGATYKLTPAGTLSTLYSFATVTGDGAYPYGGVTLGTDGNFYGTTYGGNVDGSGTVFKMTPAGSLTTLYTFTDGNDGALPFAPPIQGLDGNFYGTTCGACNGGSGLGTIYKISSAGAFTALYQFDGTHGEEPTGPLTQGTDGNFYGTAHFGGTAGYGVFFKITSTGKLTVLYNFDNTHGAYPLSGVVQGNDGNFYGTTIEGGSNGEGVVFKVTPAGRLSVLHSMNYTTDGAVPFAGLVEATDGNLYGANTQGGAVSANCPSGCGTVFKITSSGSFSVIYNFDLTTGQLPYSNLFQATNGLLYGGTQLGGTGDVDPVCSPGVFGVLYSENIGAAPFAALVTSSGKVGAKIGILGQNLSSSSVVTFGTVVATTVTLSGTTFLTATVPSGATTGAVTVTTSSGTLTSSKNFRVTPQVKTFTPQSGPVGTVVTITGVSLTQTSKVTFGGVAAINFTVNSDTQVTATVPTGAKTGKIVITTPAGTASSAKSF